MTGTDDCTVCSAPPEVGQKCRIVGLKYRTDLNGKVGEIIGNYDPQTGRIPVKVEDSVVPTELVKVKFPINLEVCFDVQDDNYDGESRKVCPLCNVTVMYTREGKENNANFQICCNKAICNNCFVKTDLITNTCPLCKADTSDCSDENMVELTTYHANQGDAGAQYRLAQFYDLGRQGVKTDQAEARRWYKLAAEQRHPRAANDLGCSYRDGEGGPVDCKLAAKWFRVAAEEGHVKAATNLGILLLMGSGVQRDLREAKKFLMMGASAGDELAVSFLRLIIE